MPASLDRPPLPEEMEVFGATNIGKVRKVNQDHFLLCSLEKHTHIHQTSLSEGERPSVGSEQVAYLAMVADGVGGGVGGEEASRLAIQSIVSYVQHSMDCYYRTNVAEQDFLTELTSAAMECHSRVLTKAQQHPEYRGMATTLTVAVGVWPYAYVLQIGDSRCYLLMEDRLVQITRDQTVAEDLGGTRGHDPIGSGALAMGSCAVQRGWRPRGRSTGDACRSGVGLRPAVVQRWAHEARIGRADSRPTHCNGVVRTGLQSTRP